MITKTECLDMIKPSCYLLTENPRAMPPDRFEATQSYQVALESSWRRRVGHFISQGVELWTKWFLPFLINSDGLVIKNMSQKIMLSQSQAGQSLKSNVKIWESGVLKFHTFHKRILFCLSSPVSTTKKKKCTVNVPCLACCHVLFWLSFWYLISIYFPIYLYPASKPWYPATWDVHPPLPLAACFPPKKSDSEVLCGR